MAVEEVVEEEGDEDEEKGKRIPDRAPRETDCTIAPRKVSQEK